MKTFGSLKTGFTTLRSLILSLGTATLLAGSLNSSAQVGPGFALQFDGVNDGVDMGVGKFANVTNNFTMELWVNPTKGRTNTPQALSGFDGLANQSYAIFPELGSTAYGSATHAGAGISVGTNGVTVVEHTSSYMPTPLVYAATITNWTHIAVVYSNKQPSLYINGILAATGLTSPKTFVHASAMLGDLGPTGNYGPYKGQIDEVRIWSSVRSQSEISANRSARLTGTESNLVAYYRLDEGTGTTTADASGNSRTGTLTNGVLWIGSTAPIGLAPTAETTTASTLNANATLNGLVTPNYLPTSVWFEWSLTTNNYSQKTSASTVSGAGTLVVSNILSGFAQGLVYHYRCVASNALGIARGKDVLFGSPAIVRNGAATVTNECHSVYTDAATATNALMAIATGNSHTIGLRGDGTVVAWGQNNLGQTDVPQTATNVVAITAGDFHNVALRSDGTVVAWGFNAGGRIDVPGNATNVVAIAAGDHHNLALRRDGSIVGWGADDYGQLTVPASASNVVAIAAGFDFSLALRSDGTVIGWGSNFSGETSIPANLSNVVAIAAGGVHSLALRADGTVIVWGSNSWGQTNVPISASNVVAIAAGYSFSLALRNDGTVIAWGENSSGQTNVPAGSNVVAIAGGYVHALGLRTDGSIIGWGSASSGQLSVPANPGSLGVSINTDIASSSPGSYPIICASTNLYGGMATVTRTVVVQDTLPPIITLLGNNPLTNFANVPLADPGATALDACGGAFPVTSNNNVNVSIPGFYTITYTSADSLGNTATKTRTVKVIGPITLPASAVSNSVATLNGLVNPAGISSSSWFEWGTIANYYSQQTPPISIGNGSSTITVSNTLSGLTPGIVYHCRVVLSNALGIARGNDMMFSSPAIVLNGPALLTNECHTPYTEGTRALTGPLAIAAGATYNLVVRTDGPVISWGGNLYGSIVPPAQATNIVAIAAGQYHALALRANGTIMGWGDNSYDVTNAPTTASNVVAIAAGSALGMALRSDGTVVKWGYDNYVPESVSNVVAISTRGLLCLALRTDRTVVAWGGFNYAGETNVPAAATNVVAISAGISHALALRDDRTVIAWGENNNNQTSVPLTATNIIAIAAGGAHSLALRADGTVIAWGYNSYGQTNVPASATNIVAVAAGGEHSLAVKADGAVIAWGRNIEGQTDVPIAANTLNLTIAGNVNTNVPGTYSLTYTTTNALGVVATATRTVTVKDTLPPVVTLLGINPILITNQANLPFVDPGATALDLCGGSYSVVASNNINVNAAGTYTVTYHSTDSYGNTGIATRSIIMALPPSTPIVLGDMNGDGIVSQAELDAVYANFVTNSPWLKMTNVAGLGGTNVTFAVTNSTLAGYMVEYSTNLSNWFPLGSATPRFLFTDTNAPANPQRYYRLHIP